MIALKGEFFRYVNEIKTYYPDQIVSMIITTLIFSVFTLLNKNTSDASFYIGYLYWYLLSSVINEASVSISYEKQAGSLNQLLIKRTPLEQIIMIKSLVWCFINLVKVFIVLFALKMLLAIPIGFHPLLIPIFFITVIGILGFTFILVGLTLKYTKTASFESIISYLLLFLTGAIIPLNTLPKLFSDIGNLFPITLGINLSKSLINTQQVDLFQLALLCLQSTAYFGIGYLIFKYVYTKSKEYGIDSTY